MIPLARPGMPSIWEKLLARKYSSQEALTSGPWQNCFQRYVVFSSRGNSRLGSKVGTVVLFSKRKEYRVDQKNLNVCVCVCVTRLLVPTIN